MALLTTSHNKTKDGQLFDFTQGIEWDRHLAAAEVRVQTVWTQALAEAGFLTEDDRSKVEQAMTEALRAIEDGSFNWRSEDEDVHMNLERFITEKHGDLGKRMHMGRSRNDLIATTLRLFTNEQIKSHISQTSALIAALTDLAEKNINVIVPGPTHLQNGQPVRLAHVFVAYAHAFDRAIRQLQFAAETTMATMPLGAAALAGSPLSLNYKEMAARLGFASRLQNSYDAVSDRDFLLQHLQAIGSLAVHLGRLSHDIIYWSSNSMALVRLPDAWSTGSSIMPNKRNPDVAEIIRAKTSRWLASGSACQNAVKNIHSSYGTDLHEVKKQYIETTLDVAASLGPFTSLVANLTVDNTRAAELCEKGHVLATEIADRLTENGVPFREAYKYTAELIGLAEDEDSQVHELTAPQVESVTSDLDADFLENLTPEFAVERRNQPGGTARENVLRAIKAFKEKGQP